MTETNRAWRWLDQALSEINGIDVSECKTPQEAKVLIYKHLMDMRPPATEETHGYCGWVEKELDGYTDEGVDEP